jgi:hypothetical protein
MTTRKMPEIKLETNPETKENQNSFLCRQQLEGGGGRIFDSNVKQANKNCLEDLFGR